MQIILSQYNVPFIGLLGSPWVDYFQIQSITMAITFEVHDYSLQLQLFLK